ncbi:MAG: GNAT family N-acetyltransferase [Planctomycetota bacterium]
MRKTWKSQIGELILFQSLSLWGAVGTQGRAYMYIRRYEDSMDGAVAAAFNDALRDVPHCWPVAAEELAAVVAQADGQAEGHEDVHCQVTFVAEDASKVTGFINAAVGKPEGPIQGRQGIIRFLCYRPGERRSGQALLEAAEAHLRGQDVNYIQAFPQEYRYRFYKFGAAYLSSRLGHVEALLGFNGYRRIRGEVFFDWLDFQPPKPRPAEVPAEIVVEWEEGKGARPSLIVRAERAGEQVGLCKSVSGAEFSKADEAQDWFFTGALWVSEALQGKGLGRQLLQRSLKELRGAGYRHACISTAWQNYRAFLFYSNHGYRVSDWTYGPGRQLTPGGQ